MFEFEPKLAMILGDWSRMAYNEYNPCTLTSYYINWILPIYLLPNTYTYGGFGYYSDCSSRIKKQDLTIYWYTTEDNDSYGPKYQFNIKNTKYSWIAF